ncbi:transporter substrate-binding domain-containing protein [Paenibacillus pasadenensis]|uniref:Amino acid ABC transporter, amino acid-binding/permease protein n=1 Tax=Paenibacillus pasadenensis TaxID=217090 RepID=A0A2N5NAS1_9BACL|nr:MULTISPECIES: ABC transporter substrate-binding protein [Paenibacillus]PLT47404.1 Amino acid ABC transporter, amino acid-binding/permease protein [Paenibacillus pasadenensis]
MKKVWTVTIAAALLLTACGQKTTNEGGAGATASPAPTAEASAAPGGLQMDKLVLGTSADYAPYEFHKKIDGKDQIVGFDIEIAKEIAKDLGAELEISDSDFDGLLLALNGGKVDLVISGMTPTEERKQNVDFSKIYYKAEQGVIVKKGEEGSYGSLDDLKGKKIGVQKGSIQEGIAKEVEGAKLTSLAKIPELILELTSGRVDALIVEKPVADQYVKTQDSIALADVKIEQSEEEAGSAIAIKKGNQELLDAVNKTIDRLQASGDIDRFVVEANELVGE